MRSLLRKEFRSLLPFLLLVLFFAATDWVFVLLTEFPDQYPLARLVNKTDEMDEGSIVSFILAFAMASGLLVRERDEGTLDFLDALPVSRTRIFVVKSLLALAVLSILPLSSLASAVVFHALSRNSLDAGFHWDILLTSTFLDLCMIFVYVSIGLALSFLRRFSFLALGLLFWGYLLFREWNIPGHSLLNIFFVGTPVFEGQRWIIPKTHLFVQLGVGGVCAAAALLMFHLMGNRAPELRGPWAGLRKGGLLMAAGTVIIFLTWIGLFSYFAHRSADDESTNRKVVYANWGTSRAQTASYEFAYNENLATRANQLVGRAETIHARVSTWLGAEPSGRITVDLTGGLPRHDGQAYWKKIRMNLTTSYDLNVLGSILGHETTHVYIDQLSRSRMFNQFNSTRFFHEGLASYVEYHLFLDEAKLDSTRKVAATVRARDQIDFDDLLDNSAFSRKADPDLVYPIGEVFVDALVKRYGETAPGKLVKAFAREDAPKGLVGHELWQDVFQSCHFNLGDVIAGFYAELDRSVEKHRLFTSSVPRLDGEVHIAGEFIRVRAVHTRALPKGVVVCRFRPERDTAERFYETGLPENKETFRVRKITYSGPSFWYQLGWHIEDIPQPIFEPWIEVPLNR